MLVRSHINDQQHLLKIIILNDQSYSSSLQQLDVKQNSASALSHSVPVKHLHWAPTFLDMRVHNRSTRNLSTSRSLVLLSLLSFALLANVIAQEPLINTQDNRVDEQAEPVIAPTRRTTTTCRRVGISVTANTCYQACAGRSRLLQALPETGTDRYNYQEQNINIDYSSDDDDDDDTNFIDPEPSHSGSNELSYQECRSQCFLEVYLTYPTVFYVGSTLTQVCQQRGYTRCRVNPTTLTRFRDTSLNVCRAVFPSQPVTGTSSRRPVTGTSSRRPVTGTLTTTRPVYTFPPRFPFFPFPGSNPITSTPWWWNVISFFENSTNEAEGNTAPIAADVVSLQLPSSGGLAPLRQASQKNKEAAGSASTDKTTESTTAPDAAQHLPLLDQEQTTQSTTVAPVAARKMGEHPDRLSQDAPHRHQGIRGVTTEPPLTALAAAGA